MDAAKLCVLIILISLPILIGVDTAPTRWYYHSVSEETHCNEEEYSEALLEQAIKEIEVKKDTVYTNLIVLEGPAMGFVTVDLPDGVTVVRVPVEVRCYKIL